MLALVTLASAEPTFVGAGACLTCHPDAYGKWDGSRHSKMVRPATAEGVRGNFETGTVELRGETYYFEVDDGQYFITESLVRPTGRCVLAPQPGRTTPGRRGRREVRAGEA